MSIEPHLPGVNVGRYEQAARTAVSMAEYENKCAEFGSVQRAYFQLRLALVKIKNEQGKVCKLWALCQHDACRSSYASWAIADEVLS